MIKHTQTIWVFDHFVELALKGLKKRNINWNENYWNELTQK